MRVLVFSILLLHLRYSGTTDWPLSARDMLDVCLDSKLHKQKPGPEDQLYQQCSAWKERSCCTKEISQSLHVNDTWHNFDLNHCGDRKLSAKCRRHFTQDLCFYECSPNVGPWLVQVEMKMRKTRFVYVPLCAADCDAWFEDCKDDYTCVANWATDFYWSSGTNKCPQPHGEKACRPFREVYKNSSTFCEQIWDESWSYAQPPHCMTLNPTGDSNRQVAAWKLEQLTSRASWSSQHPSSGISWLILIVIGLLLSWK